MQGPFLRPYGRAATINFHLFEVDGINLRTDATVGTADLDIMIDEATETSCTNAATDEGQGYSLVLTAAEMTGQRITIYVIDAATKVWYSGDAIPSCNVERSVAMSSAQNAVV